MDLNYRVHRLFPICVHSLTVDNFDQIQDVLIKESYDLRKIDPVGRQLSYRGGWQSGLYAIDKSSELAVKNNALIVITGSIRLAEIIIDEDLNFNIF